MSEFSPGLFDKVHLSVHLASLCIGVPRELKTVSNHSNCHSPPRLSSNNALILQSRKTDLKMNLLVEKCKTKLRLDLHDARPAPTEPGGTTGQPNLAPA
jgi:hypothetical protein